MKSRKIHRPGGGVKRGGLSRRPQKSRPASPSPPQYFAAAVTITVAITVTTATFRRGRPVTVTITVAA